MSIHKRLPGIDPLKRTCQSIAMLDAIMSPDDWSSRYYSFNRSWASGKEMASMRNGCGDDYFILFTKDGAAIKGFAHEFAAWNCGRERPLSGMYEGLPKEFDCFLNEPAFSMSDATFCYWRGYQDNQWNCGPVVYPAHEDPAGATWLLSILLGEAESYVAYAEEYFEGLGLNFDPLVVRDIYRHKPVTAAMASALNPESSLEALAKDIYEIGYPGFGAR